MSTVKQEVVNAAMAHLGEPPFEDIAEDPASATLAKVLAQLEGKAGAERQALSRHPWLCALTYATLTPIAPAPTNWKWANAFLLPATFVKLWEVDGLDVPFEVGTRDVSGTIQTVIWSDRTSLKVSYTEAKDYDAYSPDLCAYLALLLASRTAGPLKSDYQLADRLRVQARDALIDAQTGEAGQHFAQETPMAGGLANVRELIP